MGWARSASVRRKEKGERRKEKGERRKEKGESQTCLSPCLRVPG
jgi:hypothetical protein